MPLINLRKIELKYGVHLHLNELEFSIDAGEKICIVGRNGAGKSTLLKLIAGEIKPDSGMIEYQKNVQIALLPQEVPENMNGSVFAVVASGMAEQGALLAEYHQVSLDATDLDKLHELQNQLDACNGWQIQQQIDSIITLMQLPAEHAFADLSGGMKRRVLLARALVTKPDLLLLDEPTNHLDISAITWLEEFLQRYRAALLFVTHDRAFLQNIATRIVDLDRGSLTSWPGDYKTYLERKEAALAAEATQWALFDKKLSQEEAWIRQGVKARRTRNEGRVRELQKLRTIRQERRERVGQVKLAQQEVNQSGKMVITAEHVNYSYGDKKIINDFSTLIMRGDKVGIIGDNGVGKTTLIKLLLAAMPPQQGHVKLGTQLEISYYDQLRSELDNEKNIIDNVAGGSSTITINGKSKHIIGYLQDFLFTPQRALTPVGSLSGGERNRVALARLFAKPSNLLVLDEPTNDLDIETLDLLEEILTDYSGTLLLISHDRAFINNIVTSTLVFSENGRIEEFVGGYDDWLRQRKTSIDNKAKNNQVAVSEKVASAKLAKLSYKEQRELTELPALIETFEKELAQLQQTMARSDFYQQENSLILQANATLAELSNKLAIAYQRWEALEQRR